jgi:hypothetical protein
MSYVYGVGVAYAESELRSHVGVACAELEMGAASLSF